MGRMILFLDAPVALEHRVATVEAVVRELAQKTGRDLKIKREMVDEVLYVALKPRSAAQLMALVAKAASAEWAQDGGLYLGRSAAFRRRQEREDRAALGADLARAIKPLLDPNDGAPWSPSVNRAERLVAGFAALPPAATPEAQRANEAKGRALTPGGRLLSRFLRAIPPEEMAAIARGTTARYASRPNRRQRPLPAAAGTRQYAVERKVLATDLEALGGERRRAAASTMFQADVAPVGEPIPLVRVARPAFGPFSLEVRAVDAALTAVEVGYLNVDPSPPHLAQDLPGYAAWREIPIVPTGTTAAFLATMLGKGEASPQAARLRDPVANEPLALLMTEPMDLLAKAVGREAIVALPDESALEAGNELQQNPKLGEFADGLARSVAFESSGEALVGHARRPSESWAAKTSRTTLGDLMRTLARGIPRLETIARYALAQNPQAGATYFESVALAGAGLGEMGDSLFVLFDVDRGGRDLLRAFGALSPAQRATLEAGGSLPVGALPPSARADLESLLFVRSTDAEGVERTRSAIDPTTLADALLPGMTLSLGTLESERIVAVRRAGGVQTMSASSLGYVLEMQEHGEFLDPGLGYPVVKAARFMVGRQATIEALLHLNEAYVYRGFLHDVAVDASAKAAPYGELPPEWLKESQKTYDYYKKSRAGS